MTEDELKGDASKAHKWDRFLLGRLSADLRPKLSYYSFFSEGHSQWETGLLVLATIVIALGVWGEIWFRRKAEDAGDKLQDISDRKIADANENAARANERAATLEKEAAQRVNARPKSNA